MNANDVIDPMDRLMPSGRQSSTQIRGSRRVALSALGLLVSLSACDSSNTASGMATAKGPVPVTVTTIEPRPVSITEELPGRTAAFKVAEIRPQVSGIVAQRMFDEGSIVKAGQQLYQIEDASYQAALARAEAELQRGEAAAQIAKTRMDRLARLTQSNAVSKQDFEDAEAAYKQASAGIAAARAAVETAEIDLRYTKVYAPITGRIGISKVTEGALVTANQTQVLTVVIQLDPIYVDMPQSSVAYLRLREQLGLGDVPVALRVNGTSKRYAHTGRLQSSEVTVDQSTGAVRLRAIFPNPNHALLPGLFVQARIDLGEQEALLVPQRAASRRPDGALQVWRVNSDQTVAPVELHASDVYGNEWLITTGVSAGDSIVVEGYQKLAPGAQVEASPFRAPAAPFANISSQRDGQATNPALTAR